LTYTCAVCGEVHEGLPPGFGWRVPDLLGDVAPEQLDAEHWLVDGELVRGIDDGGKPFFGIHGNLEIPVEEWDDPFGWTIWASLSEKEATWALETWFDDDRVDAAPVGGYLLNTIPVYPETHGLLVSVHWREVGVRPLIRVEDESHPLAAEQQKGITAARVDEIVHAFAELGWTT
jgi:hypothetical protein